MESFEIVSSDGITIYGELHHPGGSKPTPLVLAFHQGGANARAEYAPIIPRLLEEGFAVMATDQRRGGDRFGQSNRTAAAFPDQEVWYCDVYPDLEAALAYAESLTGISEIIAWGSSYSATLAIQLGVEHSDRISKVLAFSPASGEVMEGCRAVPLAEQLHIPGLFLRPEREMEIDWVAEDLAAIGDLGHRTYVSSPGAHGSSMLVPERAEGDTEATWSVVLEFLKAGSE